MMYIATQYRCVSKAIYKTQDNLTLLIVSHSRSGKGDSIVFCSPWDTHPWPSYLHEILGVPPQSLLQTKKLTFYFSFLLFGPK